MELPPSFSGSTIHDFQRSNSSESEGEEHAIVPPYHPARTLVLCFDGTGDQFDADNSNIVTFFSLLKKDDRDEQMVYYQPGIGTYTSNTQNVDGIKSKIDKLLDSMIAWNLGAHVMAGYEFLMQNYKAGDKICIFGFSRGAYTARALAGMVHKVGLLPPCNHQQVPFAYKMYTRDDPTGWAQSTSFKKAFSIDVDIEFVGVWDTVDSVGIIPHRLPFTRSNTAIQTFRHALALDERRVRFRPALYAPASAADAKLGTQPGDMPKHDTTFAMRKGLNGGAKKGKNKQRHLERTFCETDPACNRETNVLEVWFAGCHCDVGGGSVQNDTAHTLARIPLRWMIRECFKMDTGIRFHAELLRRIGLDPVALHPIVRDRPPPLTPDPSHLQSVALPVSLNTEEDHEVRDALSPIYDQLDIAWMSWWPLELLPVTRKNKTDWPNMGKGRHVPKRHKPFYVHRSVKLRMEAKDVVGGPYVPKAIFKHDPVWVD
ncbi:hypothetical protein OH76DRAFT_1361801 [Lentinus brumalis]|uniref:T6SS Phospholipase effector Tle1-like catalytic domain-containing protein n=1 Tax=Lentinus brumalis TaxID=2498619 RepID=A0A371CRS8_9APHY|nr:hypothetical protein OH76DRAFT_1361801 [Polyporus brumalis]